MSAPKAEVRAFSAKLRFRPPRLIDRLGVIGGDKWYDVLSTAATRKRYECSWARSIGSSTLTALPPVNQGVRRQHESPKIPHDCRSFGDRSSSVGVELSSRQFFLGNGALRLGWRYEPTRKFGQGAFGHAPFADLTCTDQGIIVPDTVGGRCCKQHSLGCRSCSTGMGIGTTVKGERCCVNHRAPRLTAHSGGGRPLNSVVGRQRENVLV
ncbi:hypothetical protein V1294_005959 [Bradyrhizobium sp. AZCC 1678]